MNAVHFRLGDMWTMVQNHRPGDLQVNRMIRPKKLGNIRKVTIEIMEPSDMIKEPAMTHSGVQYVEIFECL